MTTLLQSPTDVLQSQNAPEYNFVEGQRADGERDTAIRKLKQYRLHRKSHTRELVFILLFLGLVFLVIRSIVSEESAKQVQWPQALGAMLSLGGAIIVYRQWLATRHEISIDKYYDRLDVANKRLEALPDVQKAHMHVFAELDKLEYVIIKYQLGYISPQLAFRAVSNFEQLCITRPGFQQALRILLPGAAYLYKTKYVVTQICQANKYPPELHLEEEKQTQYSANLYFFDVQRQRRGAKRIAVRRNFQS